MKCMITDQDIDKLVDEEVEDEDGICGGWWWMVKRGVGGGGWIDGVCK